MTIHNKINLKQIKKWQPLEEGDIVDIIAPSSGSDIKSLRKAMAYIRDLGLIPRYQKGIFGADLLCANADKKRFNQLKVALQAKDSKVIWCLRGGYGSARLLPALSRLKKPTKTKLIIGYSDITHLHMHMNYVWKWPSLHATMLEEIAHGHISKNELKDLKSVLFATKKTLKYNKLKPLNMAAKQEKIIHSMVAGGNLTILMASLGTPFQAHAQGQILALEDIGERGYRIDRMLVQLSQAGYFKGIRALLFGDFVGGDEKDTVGLWKEVQKRFAESVNFPVLSRMPLGHSIRQRPVPFMTKTKLNLGSKPSIEIHTGA